MSGEGRAGSPTSFCGPLTRQERAFCADTFLPSRLSPLSDHGHPSIGLSLFSHYSVKVEANMY
jgi:hypothetical protein